MRDNPSGIWFITYLVRKEDRQAPKSPLMIPVLWPNLNIGFPGLKEMPGKPIRTAHTLNQQQRLQVRKSGHSSLGWGNPSLVFHNTSTRAFFSNAGMRTARYTDCCLFSEKCQWDLRFQSWMSLWLGRDLLYTSQRLGLRASCFLSWENKLLWYVWDNSYPDSSRDLSVVFAWIPELSPEKVPGSLLGELSA